MKAARRWRAVRTSLSIMPGTSSMVANASWPPTQPDSGSVATTVAVRGVSRSSAISPTISRGANSMTVDTPSTPACVTSARPDPIKQERHRAFALAHQNLSRRSLQRAQLRRQRHQSIGGAAREDLQRGEFVGADGSQSGHVSRTIPGAAVTSASGEIPSAGRPPGIRHESM